MKEKILRISSQVYKVIKGSFFFPIRFYRFKKLEFNLIKKKFSDKLSFFKANIISGKVDGMLLVSMVKDYEYAIKLAASSRAIAEKYNLEVSFYELDWMSRIGWGRRYQKIHNYFYKSGLEKIYTSFGNKIVFNCEDKYYDQSIIKKKLLEYKKSLVRPEDLLTLEIENVLVGDLIYDSYLRYFHQPTIESINNELILIVEAALNIFYNFLHFLSFNNVKALLNMYSAYIEHGITVRICLHKNISVYTIGSNSYVIQKLDKGYPYHQINHTLFSPDKKLNADQLELARLKFIPRFEGKIDLATSYMRNSAYSNNPINNNLKKIFTERKKNIIIYVHDFYDSPHINRMLQFPDLYQFLKQTLEALIDIKETSVFIKLHPNGIEGCKEKTIELVNCFCKSHFHILDESVSNLNIIELKPDLIATARGTVCLEMAYFGIPTVALYDNLYSNFKFTHTCFDKKSYFSILRGELSPQNDFNKEKIYSFYYQTFFEKIDRKENSIFNFFSSYKYSTYDDIYLKFILDHSEEIFNTKFLEYYFEAL